MNVIHDSRKNICLIATGSASSILEKGTTDRWSVLKRPTMSFYKYCRLLGLEELKLPGNLKLTALVKMNKAELSDLMSCFMPMLMEKLFLYLCMNSTEIFNATTAAKELENISLMQMQLWNYAGTKNLR